MQRLILIMTLGLLISCGQITTKVDTLAKDSLKNQDVSLTPNINIPSKTGNQCPYDNEVISLGIGLIIVPSNFEIYNDSLLTDKFVTQDIYAGEVAKTKICSKFYKPDYGIMHYICLEVTNKSYKILINYSDYKFVPKTKEYEYKTWSDYILQSYGVRKITHEIGKLLTGQPLRKSNDENADTLTVPKGYEVYCPVEIKGEWLKVRYDCFYSNENNDFEGEPCQNYINKCKDPLTGWLRWKKENKLLIDIFLMP